MAVYVLSKIRKRGQYEYYNGVSWTRDYHKAKRFPVTKETTVYMKQLFKTFEKNKNNRHLSTECRY